MFVGVLAIILTLILVVGIHEAGHAIAAQAFKVKINKVSIGFGKPLIQWQSNSGCQWVWAMWPLGGYVQLLNSRITPVERAEYGISFDKKPVWVRILIYLAGAFANLITAWIALTLAFFIGIHYKLPIVKSVQSNAIAAQSGILPGDQIIAIAGYATPSWREVGMQLIIFWGKKEVPFTIKSVSTGALRNLTIDLSGIKINGEHVSLLSSMGIIPNLSGSSVETRYPSVWAAMHQANRTIVYMCYFFLMVLKQLFSGILPFSLLLGPIGLFAISIASLTQGLVVFMYFIATLSLAVALINLLPVPGLDGGSILYALIEKVRGKPISIAMEVLIHRLLFIAVCIALVQLILNDVQRFYS